MLKDLPKNLLEFQRMFPDETACRGYKHKIIALPEPKPAAMPKGMLHGLQARFYRRRGLLPPEEHPDD